MDQTLMWLYSAECPDGGLSAWKDQTGRWERVYPEVTGYLIPTLLRWGAADLAERCAAWLARTQASDGSWPGMDGVPRPFDTAAIIEGLRCMDGYGKSVSRAEEYVRSMITSEGYILNSKEWKRPEVYNLRASAIIGNRRELEYRTKAGFGVRERTHYIAYALEGALNLGAEDWVKPILELAHTTYKGLFPFYVNSDWSATEPEMDVCATAQMGILFCRVGMDARPYYDAVKRQVEPNGGVPQGVVDKRQIAWGAKFWLDFQEAYLG
jgi:hypothetical protein